MICNLKMLACLALNPQKKKLYHITREPFDTHPLQSFKNASIWCHIYPFAAPQAQKWAQTVKFLVFTSCHLLQWVHRKAEIKFFFRTFWSNAASLKKKKKRKPIVICFAKLPNVVLTCLANLFSTVAKSTADLLAIYRTISAQHNKKEKMLHDSVCVPREVKNNDRF